MPAQKRASPGSPDVYVDQSPPQRHPLLHRKRHRHEHEEQEDTGEEEDRVEGEGDCKEDEKVEEGEGRGGGEAEEVKVKAEDEEYDGEEEGYGINDCIRGDNAQKEDDSDGRISSSGEEKPEFVIVELSNIRKDVQCPICLGIIKKTRTVMECLHRFCRECIDKSMRMGNNECPACRTHCPSRRSLRDDPNYDALIAALYPDIEKYEEEELAFHEEEKNRNKQIQESINQIFQRQEALNKRRSMGKDTTGAYVTRSQRNNRNANSRRRRNDRCYEMQGSDDNEDENEGGQNSSSSDGHCMEVKTRRGRSCRRSLPSSSLVNSDVGGCIENDLELGRESRGISGISSVLVWNPEMFAWGKGGARSHNRHGSGSGSNSRTARNTRLTKLVDYLRSLDSNDNELDIHLLLVSLDKKGTPSLRHPHICCQPSLSVGHLHEYVALHTPLKAEEVEILVVNGCDATANRIFFDNPMSEVTDEEIQVLEGQETIGGLKARFPGREHLILAYRRQLHDEHGQ